MRKLLYIGGFEFPDKNAACHRVISNSKLFKMVGVQASLLGISKDPDLDAGIVHRFGVKDEFEMFHIKYPARVVDWLKYITGDSATIKFILEYKPEIIIMYNYPAVSGLRIHYLCRKHGIECMSDITEWYSAFNNNWLRRIVKWVDTSLRIRIVARLNERIITTSDYMTGIYESQGHKCLELPTLYDVDTLNSNVDDGQKSYVREKIKLVYFGSPFDKSIAILDNTQVKERLDKVLDAVKNNFVKHKIHLDVYGITSQDFLDVYPSYISTLELLGENVRFHGRVDHKTLVGNIVDSDYSIFFRDENRVNKAGFPSKMAESITLGIPVITSKISSLKKYESVDGIFLCDIGNESQALDDILDSNLVNNKISDVTCFDYKSYKDKAEYFFDYEKI